MGGRDHCRVRELFKNYNDIVLFACQLMKLQDGGGMGMGNAGLEGWESNYVCVKMHGPDLFYVR
jgi:hypothetical protein